MHYERVIIQKPDLDTCLTGLICGVKKHDNIVVLNHEANESDLLNPKVLCIEAGGSGLVEFNNFDHHHHEKYYPPACRQAYQRLGLHDDKMMRLLNYVCMVDERAPFDKQIDFPSLSNLFSGMLIVERNPKNQFIKGMEILQAVLQRDIDPFGTMPDLEIWHSYKMAKIENQKKLLEAFKRVTIYKACRGFNIGFLQTDAIGGIEAIYSQGCEIAILYNPNFGNPPVAKYTIAGNNTNVAHLLEILNSIEKGWGGRATIIGSPRAGTSIKPDELIKILIEKL